MLLKDCPGLDSTRFVDARLVRNWPTTFLERFTNKPVDEVAPESGVSCGLYVREDGVLIRLFLVSFDAQEAMANPLFSMIASDELKTRPAKTALLAAYYDPREKKTTYTHCNWNTDDGPVMSEVVVLIQKAHIERPIP